MKRGLLLYSSAFVISLYMVVGVIMVLLTGEAIVLGRNASGNAMLLEVPLLVLPLLSILFFRRKARFFSGLSLFSAFSLALFQRADIAASPLFLAGLALSFLALIAGFPREKQQVSLNERTANAILSTATVAVMVRAWSFAWPAELKLPVFLMGSVGVLLLLFRNRVVSSGGIPLLVFFYCSAAYTLYASNLTSWRIFWGFSMVLLAYSLLPLRKLLR
ncbi:hypothetical protein JCM16138_04500 [Thermococcus atlanticus]